MAPECWTNDKNSKPMDIYSLGIIFFEILTGKWPYNAKTEAEWRDCHLFSSFPDILSYRDDLTVKLQQIVYKMANKKYQNDIKLLMK